MNLSTFCPCAHAEGVLKTAATASMPITAVMERSSALGLLIGRLPGRKWMMSSWEHGLGGDYALPESARGQCRTLAPPSLSLAPSPRSCRSDIGTITYPPPFWRLPAHTLHPIEVSPRTPHPEAITTVGRTRNGS